VISSIVAAYILSIPIGAVFFFYKYTGRFSDEDFKARFGALYLNLKENSPIALAHTILFFIRRLIYALSLVFLGDYPAIQNLMLTVPSVCLIAF